MPLVACTKRQLPVPLVRKEQRCRLTFRSRADARKCAPLSSDVGAALSVLALLPEHVAAAAFAVEDAAENEKQIGQAVQVDARGVADVLRVRQGYERALGASAHRAREVGEACGARATGLTERPSAEAGARAGGS